MTRIPAIADSFGASVLRAAWLLPVLLATACGGSQVPADARTTVVSLRNLDCADCGTEIIEDMRKRPGVYDAKFDRRRAEIVVVASPSFDVFTTVKTLAANEGFEAMLGGGQGLYLEGAKFPEGADARTIVKDGVDVPDLTPHLAQGKVTVVDFSALWCEPCRKVDEHMAKVLAGRGDVAYRRLEIGDWDTPLAKRYLKNASQLPHVIVFDAKGEKIGEISGLNLAALDVAIAKGAPPAAERP